MMNQKFILNKKAGVPLSIVLIVIFTILLFTTSLVSFVLRDKNFERTIYSTSALDEVYSKEDVINFQIQNIVDNSFKGISSEQDFINNFKVQLNTLKNSDGAYLNPDLAQIESQLDASKVDIVKENNEIKKVSISFDINLKKELVVRDKNVFNTEYKYVKTFESKTQ